MELSIIIGRATQADIVAAGVKPTISGYEPDELGLLAISAKLLYHILDKFSIIKYKTEDFCNEKAKNVKRCNAHIRRRL